MPELPSSGIKRQDAFAIFTLLTDMGYGCAIKHLRGLYYIEVPVRLAGDKAYHREAEVSAIAYRAGYQPVQTGNTLRIIG